MLLRGKTVVITGVGTGLGRECAERAVEQGANVVLVARTASVLEEAAAAIDPEGTRTAIVPADVTDQAACDRVAEVATDRFGTVDGLVQVAAFEYAFGGLYDAKPDDWRLSFETNVLGALNVLRPVATAMKTAGGGSVVFIGSSSMFEPQMPQGGYAASKSALMTAMYYLANELGPDNIRCNMVIPSWMWGPPVQMYVAGKAAHKGVSEEEVVHDIVGCFPLRRMVEDGEVADVVTFFLSDLAKAITGQHLMVNAGEYFD